MLYILINLLDNMLAIKLKKINQKYPEYSQQSSRILSFQDQFHLN